MWMKSLHANVALAPNPFPVELQYPYRIVSDAMDFIRDSGEQPWILQVGFSEPHDPEQVPKPYWDMFPPDQVPPRCAGPEVLAQLGYRAQWEFGHQEAGFATEEVWRRYKSNYLGMLRLLDDQLSRLLQFLDEHRLTENTIIVYVADHGDYLMDYGLARKGVGMPESLARIPLVWAGPGIKPSSVGRTAHVSMVDFMPTLCEALGTEIPHGVQGRSLWPLLRGVDYPREEFRSAYCTVGVGGMFYEASDHVPFVIGPQAHGATSDRNAPRPEGFDELNRVSLSGTQKMVRMGEWKLIFDMMGYGQLYHLISDPCELNNLFGHPNSAEQRNALMAEMLTWSIREQDWLPTGPQGPKWQTKWIGEHNWYASHRHGVAPEAYIP
jgi:arylsulfatase A-like enzyme